jgi:hypothetical protein
MSSPAPRTYRFADVTRPGLVLGLSARQILPMAAGVVWLGISLQTPLAAPGGIAGLAVGAAVAFGRWRGAPLSETLGPAARLALVRLRRRDRWVRAPLTGESAGGGEDLPPPLAGLDLLDCLVPWVDDRQVRMAVVRDRRAGELTAVLRCRGRGFPLAGDLDQDRLLAAWGSALSPLAREQSPVIRVAWQEWSHPVLDLEHQAFLAELGLYDNADDDASSGYLGLVDDRAGSTVVHDVLLAVTIGGGRARGSRPKHRNQLAATDVLADEMHHLRSRLVTAGLSVDDPLGPDELSATVRIRSDPTRSVQTLSLTRSLAAATSRGAIEWGPMTVQPAWGQVRVDGATHRTYRIARWPQLPVPAAWLGPLLTEIRATRTVCVVMEPVSMTRAARDADREVMARESDAETRERRGFRINARDRRRLGDVTARERELAEGHAEFRFVGLVDVSAPDENELARSCQYVEQAAAQSLLDLRPLEARHDLGWVACLPLGRNVTGRGTL